MKAIKTLLVVLFFGAMAAPAYSQPNPNEVFIRSWAANGSGCPQGSVSALLSDDRKVLTMLFNQFAAQSGPGLTPLDRRRNCAMALNIHYPSGWSYSLYTADYRGFASIPSGARGIQTSTYWFAGQRVQFAPRSWIWGPYNDNYLISDTLSTEAMVWAPCGATRALNINAEVQVVPVNNNQQALMTVDSIDHQVKELYYIRWRRC